VIHGLLVQFSKVSTAHVLVGVEQYTLFDVKVLHHEDKDANAIITDPKTQSVFFLAYSRAEKVTKVDTQFASVLYALNEKKDLISQEEKVRVLELLTNNFAPTTKEEADLLD
jgi:septum formation inhibitor-activating ATPase MinD